MSTATSLHEHTTVLVCAVPEHGSEPQVVLADGSYETEAERVFWRHSRDAEVLRLPLRTAVSVRPVRHFPEQRRAADGERRLLNAVAPHREFTPVVAALKAAQPQQVLAEQLTAALTRGELARAEALARLIWHHEGLDAAHAALAQCLNQLASTWGRDGSAVLTACQVTQSVRTVLERLRTTSATPDTTSPIVLAVPAGDRHTLALKSLAHQLQEAGHSSVVVDDLPLDELAALLGAHRIPAVVVSAHVTLSQADVRRFVATVREASPSTLVVFGGPGVPSGLRGPDLVTDDPIELLAALDESASVLTQREREVLTGVANGRTNSEIADDLGLATATVKTHLDHVFAKTGTEHRAAAVARALRKGWIS